jgi:hypothetical protein
MGTSRHSAAELRFNRSFYLNELEHRLQTEVTCAMAQNSLVRGCGCFAFLNTELEELELCGCKFCRELMNLPNL